MQFLLGVRPAKGSLRQKVMTMSSKTRGAAKAKMSKEQRDLISLVKELRGIGDSEAKKLCQKFNYNKDTLIQAIQNMFEDDRTQHGDEEWKDISSRKSRRSKKKPEAKGRGGGRGHKSGRGRGRGDSEGFSGRGRRGAYGRGRGGRRSRGRGGRDSGPGRGLANKENTIKGQSAEAPAATKGAKTQKAGGDWASSTQTQKQPVLTNPRFNPNWGKPKTIKPDPTWQEAAKPKPTDTLDKVKASDEWIANPETTEATEQSLGSFNPPISQAWTREGKADQDKWSSSAWGTGTTATTSDIKPQTESSAAADEWDSSKAQRGPRGPRHRTKKVPESIGSNIRVPGRSYAATTSKWRKKEPATKPTQESNETSNEIQSTQTEMGKLSVSGPKTNEPDVILPSYVNSEKSDSMVHFGLNEADSNPKQNAHDQFLSNQANGDIFGVKTDSMQPQMTNFAAAAQQQLQEPIQNGPASSTSLSPATSLSKSQPSPQAPAPTEASDITHKTDTLSSENLTATDSNPETSANPPPASATMQQTLPMQGAKPVGRAIGDQTIMYPPHGYAAPTMHPQYGMPNGDSRTFSSMYDQTTAAPQMHHPAAAFYPDYSQLQQQQQPRYQRGAQDPRVQHSRGGRVYNNKNQNKGPKTIEADSKTATPNDGPKGKNNKQQRGFNQKSYVQRGYNKQGHGVQKNFPKGNFNQKQRQNMQPQFNQQTYAMGAPVHQYQPSAMPYPGYHPNYYNYYHQNAQFSPPGFRNAAPYYQPAPNGYNFHTAAPGNFHNPQAPANYDDAAQYPDGKQGYQSQPQQVRNTLPPNQGTLQQQQQQQQQQQHPSDSVGGFSQQIHNGSKHAPAQMGDHSRSVQDTGASHGGFDSSAPSWATSQMSAQSAQSSSKIGESGPQAKPIGNLMTATSGPSPSYRPNFYMPQSGGFQHAEQQMPQQQQVHQPYWSTGNA